MEELRAAAHAVAAARQAVSMADTARREAAEAGDQIVMQAEATNPRFQSGLTHSEVLKACPAYNAAVKAAFDQRQALISEAAARVKEAKDQLAAAERDLEAAEDAAHDF